LKEADILKDLRNISFVPIEVADGHLHKTPAECYLVGSNTPPHYQNLFTYVDLGVGASAFLKECGSQDIPSASKIADELFSDPLAFRLALDDDKTQYACLRLFLSS
jgi:hypothetical protein